jgi:SAM-dependent methyltransferase
VYRGRLWERAVPPWTIATIDDVGFVVDRLKPQPLSRFVDLGCGSGCLGRHVVDAFGSQVVGVDANPLAVRFAQESSRDSYSGKVVFETRDIAATGFADNEFDGAASLDVLLFANDKENVMREIRRILKPGARFAGTTFELRSASPALGAPAFENYPAAFEAAGLEVEVYEEADSWKELLTGILSGIVAREADLAREVHPESHKRMRAWAQTRLQELEDTRRLRFCVRKPQ